MMFTYEAYPRRGSMWVSLHGEMTWDEITPVREALWRVSEASSHRLIVDMSDVTHLDEEGLAALLGMAQKARAHRVHFHFTGEHGPVASRMRRAGIYSLLRHNVRGAEVKAT